LKHIGTISISILLLVLLSASPTSAQEINPPEIPQNEISTPSSDLDLENQDSFQFISTNAINQKADTIENNDQSADRNVKPASDIINIAISPYVNEKSPDIAHGGDYYMVVYEEEYETQDSITARVFSNDGDLVNTFYIQSCSKNYCEYPAIAYEAKSGYFLVAYGYLFSGSDWDIYVEAVSPTEGVLKEGFSMVATSTSDEKYPSIACNQEDGACLVAYQTNSSTPIMGRFLEINSLEEDITFLGAPYALTDASIGVEPRLAWGRGTETFMVTYRSEAPGGQFSSMYTHIHDQPVNSGDQYLHGNAYVISPGYFGNDHNISNNDVAFDPCTQRYIVTFGYDYYGDNSDYDIYAVAKHGTQAFGGVPFAIVSSPHYTNHSRISFVTDDDLAPVCGSMDRLVFTYWNDALGIMAGELRGNNNASNPAYDGDTVFDHLLIHPHLPGQNKSVSSPEISSGSMLGEMFVVFEYYDTNVPYEFNVKGQIIHIMEKSFLPLIIQ